MFGSSRPIDFLAVGDITTDAFIRLSGPSVHDQVNHEARELCVSFGTKIPYDYVEVVRAVGNSPNAAVAASRLGLSSALVADVGGDQNGKECVQTLENDKVSTVFVRRHKTMLTNYHYVLWYGSERTILVKHQPYPYRFPNVGKPKWMYLSSLGPAAEAYHDNIADYLEKEPDIHLAFQPGTFQIALGKERLARIYRRSDLFFCNREEAQQILNNEADMKELLVSLRGLGPRTIVITDGAKGAYLYDGTDTWFMPPYPDPKPPSNRTGAGDAFSSTVTACLAMGKSIREALTWAPINSMHVVQFTGAQKGLLTQKGIKEWLAKAPADYGPKKV